MLISELWPLCSCGRTRISDGSLQCRTCYDRTPEGRRDRALATRKSREARASADLLQNPEAIPKTHCLNCKHWERGWCTFDFPEAGGAFAEGCSCFDYDRFRVLDRKLSFAFTSDRL